MENSILNNIGIDPAFILAGMGLIIILLFAIIVAVSVRLKHLERQYDYFMSGKDTQTLEDIIMSQIDDLRKLKSEDRANKDTIRTINKNIRASFQKFGMVKYNAFKGMGGNLSFAMAILDYTNSGFVLNSVHSREGCYLYMKQVDMGRTETELGTEEKEALEQALNY